MDSIKKKMQSLAKETSNAEARAVRSEEEVKRINDTADSYEENVKQLQKKIQATEGQFDVCTEDLFNQTIKLEEMEKKAGNAEGEVGALARRMLLLEENVVRSEERLAIAITNLAKTSLKADKNVRDRHLMEQEVYSKGEKMDSLEQQLKDAQYTLGESERKYETIARKLATLESESERSNERAESGECKIIDLEDELKVVGQSLQTLEVSEEKAMKREEQYQKQIFELRKSLKVAVDRSENAEMDIQRMNVRIDQIEEDLLTEKLKIKNVSDDLNQCFHEMLDV